MTTHQMVFTDYDGLTAAPIARPITVTELARQLVDDIEVPPERVNAVLVAAGLSEQDLMAAVETLLRRRSLQR